MVLRGSPTLSAFIWLWLTASTLESGRRCPTFGFITWAFQPCVIYSDQTSTCAPESLQLCGCMFLSCLLSRSSASEAVFRLLSSGWREIRATQRTVGEMGVKRPLKCKRLRNLMQISVLSCGKCKFKHRSHANEWPFLSSCPLFKTLPLFVIR